MRGAVGAPRLGCSTVSGQSWPAGRVAAPAGEQLPYSGPALHVSLVMFALHSSGKTTENVTDSNFNLSAPLVNDIYVRHPLKAHEVN